MWVRRLAESWGRSMKKRSKLFGAEAYINFLTVLFFFVYGTMMLDASGITYYSDILMRELSISPSQYSALNAAVWCAKAISSIAVGALADQRGLRKRFVVPLTVSAGVLSLLTSFASTYPVILTLRFLWGLCVGSMLSMLVSILSCNLVKNDFGFRSGFVSAGSAVIASTVGPVLLTALVQRFSWRASFVLTGTMLLSMGLLMQFSVNEVQLDAVRQRGSTTGDFVKLTAQLWKNRTFVLCFLIGLFECAGKLAITIFAPLYLTEVVGIGTETKGILLTAMGLIYIPVSLLIPALADRFSEKKVMLVTFALCLLTPLSMVLLEGSRLSICMLVAFGNWAAATVSIFIYMIPGQVLPKHLQGTANGLIMGTSVLFGGCMVPLILGRIAELDNGLRWIMVLCSLLFAACIVCTALIRNEGKKHGKQ